MSNRVIHRMSKLVDGNETEIIEDIEEYFVGLKYMSAEGFLNKGKPKNKYTETYSDSDKLRVWQSDNVTREATTIKFTFAVICDTSAEMLKTYDDFYEYLSTGIVTYYDSKRMKKATMVLMDEFSAPEEHWLGSKPFIKFSFNMQNIYGECKDV